MESDTAQSLGIIGSSSMVGSRFCQQTSFRLIKADLNGEVSVDLTKPDSLQTFFRNYKFGSAVVFSAMTDVDTTEKERGNKDGIAWRVNVDGLVEVAKLCKKFSRGLIFISTDFVFDGQKGPYNEDDPRGGDLNKVSWYGITKIEAEEHIEKIVSDYLILRIAYPYRSKFEPKADFAKDILVKFETNSLYPMFFDQNITPTFIDDISPALELLIKKKQKGIFHIASPASTTPYDFAKYLLEVFKKDSDGLKKGSIIQFLKKNSATPRPIKGGLTVTKIKNLGFSPTDWQKGIRNIYEDSRGQLI